MATKRMSPPNLNQMSGLGLPTPGTTPLLVFEAMPQETTVQELFNKIKGKEETHYSECYVVQMTKSQKKLFEKIQKEFIGKLACISVKKTSSIIIGLTIKNCFEISQNRLPYKVCLEINNLCSYNVGSARNNIVTGLTSYENFIAIFGNCPRFFPKKNQKLDTIESKLDHESSSTYTQKSDRMSTNIPSHNVSGFGSSSELKQQHPSPTGFGQPSSHGFGQVTSTPGFGQQPPPGFGQQPPPGFGQQPPPGFGQQPPPGFGQQPPPGFGQVTSTHGFGQQPPPPGFGQVTSTHGFRQQLSGFGQQPSGFGYQLPPPPGLEHVASSYNQQLSVSNKMPYVQEIDDDTDLLNMAASSSRKGLLDKNI